MKDRIKEYIDYKGISPGELAGLLDVQRSNISHILNGRNKPGASFIERFLTVFPELNARWLLTGEGTMTDDIQSEVNENIINHESLSTVKEPIKIPKNNLETNRTINKVVLIYKDGSFSEHNPF